MPRRRTVTLAALSSIIAAFGLAVAPSASATVGTTPAAFTPQITTANAVVRQLVQCGNTMYAVGTFSAVRQNGINYTRNNAFSFSATTGALTTWNPAPSAEVNTIAVNSACTAAYLGGGFSTVSGANAHGIAVVSTTTSHLDVNFAHSSAGAVNNIQLVNGGKEVLVGGNFTSINGTARAYLASLNPSTGAVDNYANIPISGSYGGSSGPTKVYNQQVSAQGTRALIEGIFTSVGGVSHRQIAELDLGTTSATLDPWSNPLMNTGTCVNGENFYVRGANFSPDGNTIYIGTTGYVGSGYCDEAAAFANTATAPVKWRNKTGGDSLYAVAAGPNDVYVGGHERWADNPFGRDTCGAGCVPRPGIGDISATTGLATPWNPTRSRGEGVDDLTITPAGLWIASDTFYSSTHCAGQYHPGICFFPGTA
jgi:hypothetical protein